MELTITQEMQGLWVQTLAKLTGAERRLFMVSEVKAQGRGGALKAQHALGWDHTTMRKGLHELVTWQSRQGRVSSAVVASPPRRA